MNSIGQLMFPRYAKFSPTLNGKIAITSKVLKLAYADHGPEIGLCFNGGKDSSVVLDLVRRFHESAKISTPVRPFFIKEKNDFPEITEFVKQTEERIGVTIRKVQSDSIKNAIEKIVEEDRIYSFFLGQRKTDPNCSNIKEFNLTSDDWVHAMRIFPILNWAYKDIWEYIDALELPVCSLYSKGYTSIGNTKNTIPNPRLYNPNTKQFAHARELKDEAAERLSRIDVL
ncbi:Phosphoadenosine phosphosulfate reductase family protein [Trichomonas vaginalis G3]|uniref:FAD synthase n=1 Tax=Trichomonas vaginalis (strain ATCC PRA-98 / G3) TaxID=412133 RepID=A2DE77_TRIV3|nr:flavin adenine dinucleotide biosynthetic process [Trichomonas vaginalis G3]EAY21295.1 Phosphoadenosine phosphosulfate reductase family protein [Trichomonas vaginalis G3]KAI5548869.1 flavin adenine dinucleotide biosynthetic process [Trichomonas vaginalis G3]|eukprot:XP_001582281.1 Phosphoadenosine phosphosulfate reductase family protein [Trichomonas vaginalis G3]